MTACSATFLAVSGTSSARALDDKANEIAAEKPEVLSLKDLLLHDAASPTGGNPDGDVTIVAFVDYDCSFCKRSEEDLEALIQDDPKVRVIYKELPSKSARTAAKVAIAASWQGKYAEIHKAFMRLRTHPATDADISSAVIAAGVNIRKLNKDLDERSDEIGSFLIRNIQEAEALEIDTPPMYLIGSFNGPSITASVPDLPQFKKLVADAREEKANASSDAKP